MPGTMHVRRSRRATRGRQPRRGRTNRENRWAALEAQYPESVYDIIAERMLTGALGLEAPTSARKTSTPTAGSSVRSGCHCTPT